MNKDLTATQNDYAHFLPALSGFYATYVGKQRFPDPVKGPYIEDTRIPANWNSGVESLNYLNAKEGAFTYKWTLYSAGHADLDTNKIVPKELINIIAEYSPKKNIANNIDEYSVK